MAASFPRPDPTSPASIAEANFNTARRGYSTDEVQAFLRSVSAELARLQERERQMQGERAHARSQTTSVGELDDETITRIVGDETVRVLQTAREAAATIRIRAEENAARIIAEANDEVNRLRQEIDLEVSRKRKDAASDAEAELAMAKQQGREMVNEARAYRERVLSDLDRRTKLARQQIEELAHGRDRLLQVFERARLVAVDVTSELAALDGPDELVNLAPTTGPVPLMVPSRGRAADAVTVDEVDVAEVDVDEVADDADELADGTSGVDVAAAGTDEADAVLDQPEVGEHVEADVPEADVPEADVSEAADDEVDGADDDPSPARDANVVSLFRRRPDDVAVGDEADADTAGEPDAGADGDRPDVAGIFERLRQTTDEPVADDTAPDDTAPDDTATDDTAPEVVRATGDEGDAQEVVDDEPGPSTPFTRRDEAIVPLIVGAARRLKRTLADEQNGVLDALRAAHAVTTLEALLPPADGHTAVYLDVLDGDLLLAAVAGAGEVGVADTKALHSTLRRAGATERARALVRSDLVESLRARLERCVVEGGGDNAEVARRVRAVYREWKTQHIDDQLDDVFRFAYAGGLAAMIEPGTTVGWTLDPSETACADCEDNSLSGGIPVGDPFPTGHAAAPAHGGCRCLTLPTSE